MSLFRLDASILPHASASRELGDLVETEWLTARPTDSVRRRNVATEPIAANVWADAVTAQFVAVHDRTVPQRDATALARSLADELIGAEALLFTVPLYNFGISQHFKTWFDVVHTVAEVGPQGTGLVGKPAVLVTVLGGNYNPGTPKEGWDHSTGWLSRVMHDVWQLDLVIVERPFTLVGVNPALDAFADLAADLKATAVEAATAAGRALPARAARTPNV